MEIKLVLTHSWMSMVHIWNISSLYDTNICTIIQWNTVIQYINYSLSSFINQWLFFLFIVLSLFFLTCLLCCIRRFFEKKRTTKQAKAKANRANNTVDLKVSKNFLDRKSVLRFLKICIISFGVDFERPSRGPWKRFCCCLGKLLSNAQSCWKESSIVLTPTIP